MTQVTGRFLMFAVLFTACGVPLPPGSNSNPNPGNGTSPSTEVLGRWRWPQSTAQLTLTTELTSDSFTMIGDCNFTGFTITATATSAASVDDTTIDILSSSHDDESANGEDCHANISMGSFTYVLHGSDTLDLQAPGESPLTLTRVSN